MIVFSDLMSRRQTLVDEHHIYKKSAAMKFLTALLFSLVLLPPDTVGSSLRAIVSDQEQDHDTYYDRTMPSCTECSYRNLQSFCFPHDRIPRTDDGSWQCHHHHAHDDMVVKYGDNTMEEIEDEGGLWDCLLDGSDSESCKSNSQGTCVWCAEPIAGLCVTPGVAAKIGRLPFFNCGDSGDSKK